MSDKGRRHTDQAGRLPAARFDALSAPYDYREEVILRSSYATIAAAPARSSLPVTVIVRIARTESWFA
jgi:hypothetical protein